MIKEMKNNFIKYMIFEYFTKLVIKSIAYKYFYLPIYKEIIIIFKTNNFNYILNLDYFYKIIYLFF